MPSVYCLVFSNLNRLFVNVKQDVKLHFNTKNFSTPQNKYSFHSEKNASHACLSRICILFDQDINLIQIRECLLIT